MRETGNENKCCLVQQNSKHGSPGNKDADVEKDTTPNRFQRVVAKAGGHIYIVVCMVDDVKTPEKRHLVFNKMTEPSCKKIKDQAGGDDKRQWA